MRDLREVVHSCVEDNTLMVTDYKLYIVANEVLKSVQIFEKHKIDDTCFDYADSYSADILDAFGLDINNNHMHLILWQNWMKFLAQLEIIQTEIRWEWPSSIWTSQHDIEYLENIVNNQLEL